MRKNFKKILAVILCLFLSGILVFVVAPEFSKPANLVNVVTLIKDVDAGELISSEMLNVSEVSEDAVRNDYAINIEDVVGKYALQNLYKNDFINTKNISINNTVIDDLYLAKSIDKYYFSLTVKTLAASVGNSIKVGDLVSISAFNSDEDTAKVYDQLEYVNVIAIKNAYGAEVKEIVDNNELRDNLSDVLIVEVNKQQLELLTYLEYASGIHVSFKFRGTETEKQNLLAKQELYWSETNE